jgi:hypothetical protein
MPHYLAALQNGSTTTQFANVLTALGTSGGRLMQAWGLSAIAFEGDNTTRMNVAAEPVVAAVSDVAIPSLNLLTLDALASEVARAWNFGFLPAFLAPPPPATPLPSILPPSGCGGAAQPTPVQAPVTAPTFMAPASTFGLTPVRTRPDRRALVGTVGVVILYIDGPAGSAAMFAPDDTFWMNRSLTAAFDGLYNAAPRGTHLIFTPAIHHVSVNVNPLTVPAPANPASPTAAEYELVEASWRDPALTALGVTTGRAGFRALINKSKFTFPPDWALVICFTKYRAAWPAYAPDYRDVVVSFDMVKNQIGLAELPIVIAHEMGHTVGARDEYASSNCSVTEQCGFSNDPNANCAILPGVLGPPVPNPLSVACLMKGGTFSVCLATKSHFGWGDRDGDGTVDAYDPDFAPLP